MREDLRIPDCHLDITVINSHRFDFKIDANSWLHGLEDIVSEAEQYATLTDACVDTRME